MIKKKTLDYEQMYFMTRNVNYDNNKKIMTIKLNNDKKNNDKKLNCVKSQNYNKKLKLYIKKVKIRIEFKLWHNDDWASGHWWRWE